MAAENRLCHCWRHRDRSSFLGYLSAICANISASQNFKKKCFPFSDFKKKVIILWLGSSSALSSLRLQSPTWLDSLIFILLHCCASTILPWVILKDPCSSSSLTSWVALTCTPISLLCALPTSSSYTTITIHQLTHAFCWRFQPGQPPWGSSFFGLSPIALVLRYDVQWLNSVHIHFIKVFASPRAQSSSPHGTSPKSCPLAQISCLWQCNNLEKNPLHSKRV